MILTCPSCTTRFLLSAQVLAPDGRRVKCSNCGEEWFQLPDPDELVDNAEHQIEEIPEAVKPIPEGSSVPALQGDEDKKAKAPDKGALGGYIGAAIVFLMILGGLIVMKDSVVKTWMPSAGLYEMLGVSIAVPGEGIVFDNVKARMVASGNIRIEGSIINLTKEEQFLPAIEASIRNEAGEVIMKTLIDPPFEAMQPESSVPFKTRYVGETNGADHVQLKFVLTPPAKAKSVSEDGGNTPVPHADGSAHPPGGEAH